MLLTHPLPDSRLSDARNRANQMPRQLVQSSQDYLLARVRTLGMYSSEGYGLSEDLLDTYSKGNIREQIAAKYGRAILFYEAKKYDEARNLIQPLLAKDPKNVWMLDLLTDIDLGQNKAAQAIARLEAVNAAQSNNPVLLLNLANAYVEGNQPAQASKSSTVIPLPIRTILTAGICWLRPVLPKVYAMKNSPRGQKAWRWQAVWIRR